jgi:hypothetical protein
MMYQVTAHNFKHKPLTNAQVQGQDEPALNQAALQQHQHGQRKIKQRKSAHGYGNHRKAALQDMRLAAVT